MKDMYKIRGEKGQTTLFIIIGIVVVAVALVIYFFYPEIQSGLGLTEENPSQFIDSCIKQKIIDTIEILSMQGGSVVPEHYIVYNGNNIEYLCYTNEFYRTCVVQQPLLIEHVEKDIEEEIKGTVRNCFLELKQNYESDGYNVNMQTGETNIELLPKRIIGNFNYSLTMTKGGESTNYEKFDVIVHNNLYELLSIANSIIEWEARFGDVETTTYMAYYRDLKVEKKKQTEGSTIYILTDTNDDNQFQFASRSVAWPPGYGV